MNNTIICPLRVIVAAFLVVWLAACNKEIDENPSENNNTETELWGDGIERGYKQNEILDMVLIYQGGSHRVDWTPTEMLPYVIYTNEQNKKDWFFDGFLFLEFYDGQSYNFCPGSPGTLNARKQEWTWLANRHFEDGKAIKALNSCITEGIKELGAPSFKHRVVIGLPEPILNQKDWGELNGVALDFSKQEDRIAALKWYIDDLIDRFEKSNLQHLELAGFYWVNEQISETKAITLATSDYIHEKGKQFYWIPYYLATGYTQWKEFGFDIAYLQPNYFFDTNIGDERVDRACDMAYTHNMGLEMEFDNRALASNGDAYRNRLIHYLNTFKTREVSKNASIAYYEGGRGIDWFTRSKDAKDKEILELLYAAIKERRTRLTESLLYQQDFQKNQAFDNKIWNIVGSNDNVRMTEHGMEISSGGNIAKVNTSGKLDMTYGRIEIKARLFEQDENATIRLHLMPVTEKLGGWPASGELYLCCYEGAYPSRIRVGANTDQINETKTIHRESVLYLNPVCNQTHTFVCEWEEKTITFWVDGMKVNIQEDLFDKQYSSYPNYWPFNEKFYLEISVLSGSKDAAVCIESIKVNKK
ncbi:MAG: DUF4855 domain-containing protein [Dysgonamonadaceae bacterium]|nr:DUF4855 domain-containing protein [Dysgonamonadaceae bacterium]